MITVAQMEPSTVAAINGYCDVILTYRPDLAGDESERMVRETFYSLAEMLLNKGLVPNETELRGKLLRDTHQYLIGSDNLG